MRLPLPVIKTAINRIRSNVKQINIELTDSKGVILTSGSDERVNMVHTAASEFFKDKPANDILEYGDDSTKGVCLPIVMDRETVYFLCVEGKADDIENIARVIKSNIETFMEYELVTDELIHETRNKQRLLQDILSERADTNREELYKRAAAMEYDLALPRLVIIIELEPRENKYFNVRLNLGYNAAVEQAQDEIAGHVSKNIYMNNQDIIALHNSNEVVVLKSFAGITEVEKIYSCMDVICRDIYDSIKESKAFKIRISFGGLVDDFQKLRLSYKEARDIMELGKVFVKDFGVIRIQDTLFEYITKSLPVQLLDMAIRPIALKLKDDLSGSGEDVLYTVEQFLESNMNIARTADKIFTHRNTVAFRLEKLKKITGLDPVGSFTDLLLLKFAIIYMRLNS